MREEDVDKYSLDQLAAIALDYGLIDAFEDVPNGKRIVFRHHTITLPEATALPILQAIVHAWLVGTHAFP